MSDSRVKTINDSKVRIDYVNHKFQGIGDKSQGHSKSYSILRQTKRNKSQSLLEHSAEEIKETDIKPYNFISEQTKNEALSKLKNKEKVNSNWVNESENSGSLSYSKVFKASGRDYANIIKPNEQEDSAKKNENYSKIMGYSDDEKAKKFSSYKSDEEFKHNTEISHESNSPEPSIDRGKNLVLSISYKI